MKTSIESDAVSLKSCKTWRYALLRWKALQVVNSAVSKTSTLSRYALFSCESFDLCALVNGANSVHCVFLELLKHHGLRCDCGIILMAPFFFNELETLWVVP